MTPNTWFTSLFLAILAGCAVSGDMVGAADAQPVVELERLPARCMCFSSDGNKLAVGGSDDGRAVVHIIDTDRWQPSVTLALRGITVMAIAFSTDSKLLFAAVETDVVVFDVSDAKELARLSRHTELVFTIAASSDGRYLATSGEDGRVCLWDAKKLTHVNDLDGYADSIFAVAFDGRSAQLASAGRDIFRVWPGLQNGQLEDIPFHDSALDVCFSPKGDLVIAGTVSGNLVVAKCDQLKKPPQIYRLGSYIHGVAFVEGCDLVLVGINRELTLFDLNEGKIKRRLHRFASRIDDIAVDLVNKRVAVGTWDRKIKIWNAIDLVEVGTAVQKK